MKNTRVEEYLVPIIRFIFIRIYYNILRFWESNYKRIAFTSSLSTLLKKNYLLQEEYSKNKTMILQ